MQVSAPNRYEAAAPPISAPPRRRSSAMAPRRLSTNLVVIKTQTGDYVALQPASVGMGVGGYALYEYGYGPLE